VRSYFGAFFKAYRYMRNKWWAVLPVESSCTTISRSSLGHLKMASVHQLRVGLNPPALHDDHDAVLIARRLGFEP